MKVQRIACTLPLVLLYLQPMAQQEPPKGFRKGSVILVSGATFYGFVKDNIRSNASVVLVTDKKKSYDGSDLIAVTIDSTEYLCFKGDFFKVICTGELCFLQKFSDASHKPVYVGSEAMFINGTEGSPGDYFLYDIQSKSLKLITRKNLETTIASSFANCTAAIQKAKEVQGDMLQLKDAVVIYNNRNK